MMQQCSAETVGSVPVMVKVDFIPVIREGLFALCVQRAGGGEHDGCVQVADDTAHRAGCVDTGLSTAGTSLEG